MFCHTFQWVQDWAPGWQTSEQHASFFLINCLFPPYAYYKIYVTSSLQAKSKFVLWLFANWELLWKVVYNVNCLVRHWGKKKKRVRKKKVQPPPVKTKQVPFPFLLAGHVSQKWGNSQHSHKARHTEQTSRRKKGMCLPEYICWVQKCSCVIHSCFKTQRLRMNFWVWFTYICTSWILLSLVGYWFKYFLNSDSSQGQKLKPLGGEPAAWTMSNQPPDSKQLCMGLSNYQPHLPLCCRSTRNPRCSSTCRSVVRPPSSSCVPLHRRAHKCNGSWNCWLGKAETHIWTIGFLWDNLMWWVSSLPWQILSCKKLCNIFSRKKT